MIKSGQQDYDLDRLSESGTCCSLLLSTLAHLLILIRSGNGPFLTDGRNQKCLIMKLCAVVLICTFTLYRRSVT